MKESRSVFLPIRGVDYHCRIWGPAGAPRLFLLHGSQDVSASWQFTVDSFEHDWEVVAPDWRGNGLSGWTGADSYWFPDYVGDLHALLQHFSPEQPARVVGHSMGAHIAALYAGVRPDGVGRFVNVDGFGPPGGRQDPAPRRLAKWLAQLDDDTSQRPYESYDEFALRMQSENPRLTDERARFLVRHWGKEAEDGTVVRRADPALKRINPLPLSQPDVLDCWRQTQASVLWVDGAQSGLWARLASNPQEFQDRASAYADLQVEHVDDSGHNIHHDQPERLAAVIEAFMRGR
ncbi:alpha/beta fold hydrolase [Quisquiliibacterium transsilvanicum]|uniref:Pimeloyl-ACP methyl ester carboxylesterase n=1 Tax=Quisquiliibacterium transsilvanicum TaxID=1549638 RepID=A0A7W8M9R0_9BURK|nr:pimeloyl-ACP methyl ester carboxylesterase [Quisquiliibacterium transsilvanicum]